MYNVCKTSIRFARLKQLRSNSTFNRYISKTAKQIRKSRKESASKLKLEEQFEEKNNLKKQKLNEIQMSEEKLETEDEEMLTECEENTRRTRFKRRNKSEHEDRASKLVESIARLAEKPDASSKLISSTQFSLYIFSVPFYCGFYAYQVTSPNFFLAWLFNRITAGAWSPLTTKVAKSFINRHPHLKYCKFSKELPDSFRQDPQKQFQHLMNRLGRDNVEGPSLMAPAFEVRRRKLKGPLEYGLSWDIAENQRCLIVVPFTYALFSFLDVHSMLMSWMPWIWNPTLMPFLLPIAATSYLARFFAPVWLLRCAKRLEDRYLL